MNTTSPYYLFRFDRLEFEMPYLHNIVTIEAPWSYALALGSSFLYLLLITTIFPMMKSKFTNNFSTTHYALLFLYSLFAFIAGMIYMLQTGQITNWRDYICIPIPPWLRLISITFTVSKIWEWLDTGILIAKGHSLSKIGFLHIYHHATTFVLFLAVMNLPGGEKSGVLFNGFVHTLMYYHFAYRLPKIFRPLITFLQIVQLASSTYIWHITPDVCPNYRNFPNENFIEFLTPYVLVPVDCLFFLKFFFEQYLFSSSKKSKKTE